MIDFKNEIISELSKAPFKSTTERLSKKLKMSHRAIGEIYRGHIEEKFPVIVFNEGYSDNYRMSFLDLWFSGMDAHEIAKEYGMKNSRSVAARAANWKRMLNDDRIRPLIYRSRK